MHHSITLNSLELKVVNDLPTMRRKKPKKHKEEMSKNPLYFIA